MALALILISILSTFSTLTLTAMIQNHAEHRGLLAIPNHRSSHDEPTPTSGGWSFVFIGLCSAVGIVYYYKLTHGIIWFYILPLAVISAIGGVDDVRPLTAKLRLSVQITCSVVALSGLYLASPDLSHSLLLLFLGALLAGGFLVWFINLYNFMDGLDGIATLEAITVVLSWLAILSFSQQSLSAPELMVVVVFLGSMLGFLCRNWSPAGIFMGDVGSGYIGFGLATGYLYLIADQPDLWIAYLIPCSVFWVDATYTLLRRVTSQQAYLQAHRSHAYQILSRKWNSHSKVVIAVGLFNVFWLLPLALIAATGTLAACLALAASWTPLLWVAYSCNAGLVND